MPSVPMPVVGGHVYCRIRHDDVDVTTCMTCERLGALCDKTSPPYIVCDVGDAMSGEPDPRFGEWWYRHHRRSLKRLRSVDSG